MHPKNIFSAATEGVYTDGKDIFSFFCEIIESV